MRLAPPDHWALSPTSLAAGLPRKHQAGSPRGRSEPGHSAPGLIEGTTQEAKPSLTLSYLGVDEFSVKRGQHYESIICDLE